MKISKKKILLGVPIALISLELYFGVLFGYLLGRVLSGKEAGQKGKIKSLVFNIGNQRLHLHHWLYGLGVLISAVWYSFLPFPQFSFGFLGGLIFQGISCYPDWRQVLTKQK